MTVAFELDPANSAVVIGVLNGIAEASGFITPLVSSAFTSIEEGRPDYWEVREKRWRNFFFLNGVIGVLGVMSVIVALVWGRKEWVKHPSLCVKLNKNKADCVCEVVIPRDEADSRLIERPETL